MFPFNRQKLKAAVVRNSVVPPAAIIDNFLEDIGVQRDFHYREGKTLVQHLIDRKAGKEAVVYLFPEEKEYLEETYGVLVS